MVPPYYMENIICPRCKKPAYKNRITKGVCFNCYRKYEWKQKLVACARCGRMMPNQAKGYCSGCYNILFHLEKVKAGYCKKYFKLDLETYKRLTKECLICGFSDVVDLHHLDMNRNNCNLDNLVPVCPNHHRMLHSSKYREELYQELEKKGYKIERVPGVKSRLAIPIEQPKETTAPPERVSFTLMMNSRNEFALPMAGKEGN